MNLVLGSVIDGLILSAVYALAALGFVIIYRASRIFNFAQGEFMMFGAYFVFLFADEGLPVAWAVLFSLAGCVLIATGIFYLLIRPLTGQPLFSAIIITMGVAIVMRSAAGLVWGPVPKFLPRLWAGQTFNLGGAYNLAYYDAAVLVVAGTTYGLLILFLRNSTFGLKMQAAAENPTLASQAGVNLNAVYAVSWALAAISAAVAGAVFAGRTAVSPNLTALGLGAFPAALVGGFDSVGGTLVGALLVGFIETVATIAFGGDAKDAVAAVVLLVVLAIRPYGLFGSRHIVRL